VFANPQPTEAELEDYYGPEYFQHNAEKFLRFPMQREVELRLRRYLSELRAVCPRGRVLDVGCGTGMFLWLCREEGYTTTGVELSSYASQLGRERLNLEIRTGRLEAMADDGPRFDAITMWDFLEHTSDPVSILRRAHALLADGGHLLMTVPNVGSWWARCMGSRWVGFEKASEHLFYFTHGSLERMLALAGFTPLKVKDHSWICTTSFLAERGTRAWPAAGRMVQKSVSRLGIQDRVVRFPSVNLLAVGRKTTD
jgi:2-polyprenyl-3-methyl-5-hydroxy-6-metoxy-1,4-benzoquinol methylase